jgi:hypothetical protein
MAGAADRAGSANVTKGSAEETPDESRLLPDAAKISLSVSLRFIRVRVRPNLCFQLGERQADQMHAAAAIYPAEYPA